MHVLNTMKLLSEYTRLKFSPFALRSFFFFTLILQDSFEFKKWGVISGNYYEFGVGWGSSLSRYLGALESFRKKYKKETSDFHVFGFDSFAGLPPATSPNDINPSWNTGAFSHKIEEIEKKIKKFNELRSRVRFVKGFYNESLTGKLLKELKATPPSIINIDVDYYSSAKEVLTWIWPILQNGTIFYFDDIWSYLGNPEYGELAAIREFNEEGHGYLVPWNFLGYGIDIPTQLMGKVYIYTKKPLQTKE